MSAQENSFPYDLPLIGFTPDGIEALNHLSRRYFMWFNIPVGMVPRAVRENGKADVIVSLIQHELEGAQQRRLVFRGWK